MTSNDEHVVVWAASDAAQSEVIDAVSAAGAASVQNLPRPPSQF